MSFAWARPSGFTAHQAKTMDALLQQCNRGVGKACFDYGINLERFLGRSKHRERVVFVRRACKMAFEKACAQTVDNPQPLRHSRVADQASRPKSNDKTGADLSR